MRELQISLAVMMLTLVNIVANMNATAWAVPVEQEFDGMTFVQIDTQSFIFGSDPSQANYQAPESPRVVPFSHSFWMGKYEITQAQWQAVMGSNPSTYVLADGPVETITWQQAKDFVAALNVQAGANHYRLPTEAEWEYVAKAGEYTQWSFGDNIADLADYTYRDGNYAPRTVGQRQGNAWGVYDLYGNVYEWTEDWYHYSLPNSFGGCPPSTGTYKVIRGGSNACNSLYLRSASRQFAHPDRKAYYIGLRIVRVDNPALDLYHPDNTCNIGPFCGDGYVDAGEQCDDGNTTDGDGCSANCTVEADDSCDDVDQDQDGQVDEDFVSTPLSCGIGVCQVNTTSTCVNGNEVSNCIPGAPTGSDNDCDNQDNDCDGMVDEAGLNCPPPPVCGNNVVEAGEQCDDDNTTDGDGCSANCTFEGICGNGIVEVGEECDAAFNNSDFAPDSCRASCQNPHCGDAVQDSGEQCDDGNTTDGDGCSATCQTE